MPNQMVQPESMPKPSAPYSLGVTAKAGVLVFISGQVPVDAQGRTVGIGDVSAQARQVFENIKTVVEAAGGTMADIVKTTTFLTDITASAKMHAVRREFFQAPYPGGTAVEISRLASDDWMMEIEAIAVI